MGPSDRRPPDSTSHDAILGALADDYLQRLERGERPNLDELARQHPEVAGPLRELLPLLSRAFAHTPTPPAIAAPAAPTRMGEYEIVRELGRGGMGVVYEAVQPTLARRVALKVVSCVQGPRFRERFRREVHAAARLSHPNIVPVLGAGEHDGTPFYAMQLIAGRSLDELPRADPLPTALIGLQVAEALAYAHARGVHHRDVKPGNILLDDRGTAWVADFGLALLEDETTLTGTGDFLGSPRYAPPERFRGVDDPRGDQYGLGATLYELLAGRPAFDAPGQEELLRQVLEEVPRPLRSLRPDVPRDLETVILKAMARDVTQRYTTCSDLAADLRRFLAGLPVQARPAGPVRRLIGWARRRPAVAALSVAVLITVALGLVGLAWQARRAEAQRQQAVANFRKARAAVNDCYAAVTEHPDFQGPGMQPAREVLLRTALRYYQELLALRDDSETRAELAETYFRVGVILGQVGTGDEAVRAFEEAMGVHESRLAAGPSPAARRGRAGCLLQLGMLHTRLERYDRAERDLLAARDEYAELSDVGEASMADHAATYSALGRLYRTTDRVKEAEGVLTDAVRLREAALRPEGPAAVRRALVLDRLELSRVLEQTRRPKLAWQSIQAAVAQGRELGRLDPDRADHLYALANAVKEEGAFHLMHAGKVGQMRGPYVEALALADRLVSEYRRVRAYQHLQGAVLSDLGLCYTLHIPPRREDALACFQRGRQVFEGLISVSSEDSAYHEGLANLFHNQGLLHNRLREYDRAEEMHRLALPVHEKRRKLLPRSNSVRLSLFNTLLALAQRTGGRGEPEAMAYFQRAETLLAEVEQTEPQFTRLPWLRSLLYSGRAGVHANQGRHALALADWERANRQKHHVEFHLRGLVARARLGEHRKVAGEVEAVVGRWPKPSGSNHDLSVCYFHAVRVFAQVAEAARADINLPPTERSSLAAAHIDKAMDLLRTAHTLGAFDRPTRIDELRRDPDFEPLRRRPDFHQLLAKLPLPPQ